jgi:hypothetical protein
MPRQAKCSNETIKLTKIVAVPERDWALRSTANAQREEAERAKLRERGTLEARRASQRWNYNGVPSDAIGEHDGLVYGRLVWILSAPTAGVTPQPANAIARMANECRLASWEYLTRQVCARTAHIVIRTRAVLSSDLVADPVLRCCLPFDAELKASGILDYSPFGIFAHELYVDREATHRVVTVNVGGVSACQFPVNCFVGYELWVCVTGDCWWEGWEDGETGELGRFLEARVGSDDATPEERHAHEALKRGALSDWLARASSDIRYDTEQLRDYEAVRAQAFRPPVEGEARPACAAAVPMGRELRLARFRLRAESWPRGCFGDPELPGSAGYSQALASDRLGLRVGRGAAECIVAAWKIGTCMARGSHVGGVGSKRSRTMPMWGSAEETDRRILAYNHDFVTVYLHWGGIHMPFDWRRWRRWRQRVHLHVFVGVLWLHRALRRVRARRAVS